MEQMPKHICEKRTYTVEEIATLLGITAPQLMSLLRKVR